MSDVRKMLLNNKLKRLLKTRRYMLEDRIPIESSFINNISYDSRLKLLDIEMLSGYYRYEGVPEDVFLGLKWSSSPGQYYNVHIKNKYRSRKLDISEVKWETWEPAVYMSRDKRNRNYVRKNIRGEKMRKKYWVRKENWELEYLENLLEDIEEIGMLYMSLWSYTWSDKADKRKFKNWYERVKVAIEDLSKIRNDIKQLTRELYEKASLAENEGKKELWKLLYVGAGHLEDANPEPIIDLFTDYLNKYPDVKLAYQENEQAIALTKLVSEEYNAIIISMKMLRNMIREFMGII